LLKRNGVNVDKVYTSESLMCYKPSEQFYKIILNENSLINDEVLFVGDSLIDDVFGPSKINIKTCWLNRNKYAKRTITPDCEIHSLIELTHIIK